MKFRSLIKFIFVILVVVLFIRTGFMIRNILSTLASPYNVTESIYWLAKNVSGTIRNNSGIVENIPNSCILNRNVRSRYKLGFVGDILPAKNRSVNISPGVKEFFSDSDYLIGNFEGTITGSRKNALILLSDLRHNKKNIETLIDLFPPERTYLSVSNNHAGDFGKEEFLKSVKVLESRNFNVFGWNERPYFDINDDIRIVSGTMWSNRDRDYVFMLKDAEHQMRPGAFNFLYPHFGYEFELYPRPEIVALARHLIRKFGAIIGHHSHCPQPVSAESVNGINKVVAYSLGDFSGALTTKKYQYGIVLKVELGQNGSGEWLLGKVEWHLTRCRSLPNGDFIVSLSDERIF